MRRFLPLLILALLLAGCGAEPEPTVPPTEPAVTEAPPAVEPTGYYDPDSALEEISQGGVKLYPLNRTESTAILPFGDNLLLVSGHNATTLSVLSGSTLYVSAVANLDCYVDPASPAFLVTEKGVTYYDAEKHSFVFLDAALKEVNTIFLPDETIGQSCVSHDRKTLYYATADAIRAIDLDSGLDRLLRQMRSADYELVNLHLDGRILECLLHEGDFSETLFIDVQTGQTLREREADAALWTHGDRYVATHLDGNYRELLVGSADAEPKALYLPDFQADVHPLLNHNGLVTLTVSDGGTTFDYYDLATGMHTSALTLEGIENPRSMQAVPDSGCIWFLGYDSTYESDVLYRWDLQKNPVDDSHIYLASRYSAGNPDEAGLERCAETAAQISEKHGVEVLLWQEAIGLQPPDYTLIPEYQVPLLENNLRILDRALSVYPEGFLKKAAFGAGADTIRICLVRIIAGNSGYLDSVAGLQYRSGETVYVALTMGAEMEQTLYHELFHIIESRILSRSSALDNWNSLNPDGFDYDYDYIRNLAREDTLWISGDDRAFIDHYSMSFPKEDRARIMEYAMMPDCGSYFETEAMRSKLRQLCIGIREAYHLEESEDIFQWEQYLTAPLTNT